MYTYDEIFHVFNATSTSTIVPGDNGNDVNYGLHETNDEFVIVLEGSYSFHDWFTDFRFLIRPFTVPYKDMKVKYFVHSGFISEWQKVDKFFINLVDEKIKEWESKGIKKIITISGHSLGGALSQLLAETLWFNFPEYRDHIRMITTGAPRVYGFYHHKEIKKRFDDLMDVKMFRNGWDIVPTIPPAPLYWHIHKRTQFGDHSFKSFFTLNHFTDHLSWHYRDVMDKELGK